MARVLVATQPWGVLWEKDGNRNVKVPLPGVLAAIDTTVYTASSGGTTIAAPSFVTNTDGELPGYVEEGNWTLTVNAETFAAPAIGGGIPDRVASLEGVQQRTFRDSFTRSDRALSGDISPGGVAYVTTGGSPPLIVSEFYDIAVAGGTPGYLFRTLSEAPDMVNATFEVVAGTGVIPAMMIGCNDPTLTGTAGDGIEDMIHCIVTDDQIAIQVVDGVGGASVVALNAALYPGGGVIAAGRYAVSIQAFGTTLVMMLWSLANTGASVVATVTATDSRIGDFWDRRCVWELAARTTGQKRIRVSSIEAGPAQVPGAHGELHSAVDPIPVDAIHYVTGGEFLNSWTNFGSGYLPVGYYRDPFERVHLLGHAAGGSLNTAAFTLPAGYRPLHIDNPFSTGAIRFAINEAGLYLDVLADGSVMLNGAGSNAIVSLNGIGFRGGLGV
jgi:hypothetical protein